VKKKYAIVWQPISPGCDAGVRFGFESLTGSLPFFLDGHDLELLENKQRVELTEFMLLRGILVEYLSNPPLMSIDGLRPAYENFLNVCVVGFRFPSMEELVLRVAARLRADNGNYASYKALSTGMCLLPCSSKIRSDLIMDIWLLLQERVAEGRGGLPLLEEIIDAYSGINLREVNPDVIELLVYIHFVALRLAGTSSDLDTFLKEFVFTHVSDQHLKNKIKHLLECDDCVVGDAFL
jgi:hypothetical protein